MELDQVESKGSADQTYSCNPYPLAPLGPGSLSVNFRRTGFAHIFLDDNGGCGIRILSALDHMVRYCDHIWPNVGLIAGW